MDDAPERAPVGRLVSAAMIGGRRYDVNGGGTRSDERAV